MTATPSIQMEQIKELIPRIYDRHTRELVTEFVRAVEIKENMNATLLSRIQSLEAELKHLYKGYVNSLEAGRDRIIFLGGTCDPVDVMEKNDPYLIQARAALGHQEGV